METIATTQARLEAFITDYCAQPSIALSVDLSPGSVLSELLIKLSAQLHNQLKLEAEAVSLVGTVKAALEATTDTTSPAIDAVASNFNVVRDTGVLVRGKVKVSVAFDRAYYLGSTFQLVHPSTGSVYTTERTYRADSKLDDNTGGGVLKLYREGNGRFYFLLPVVNVDASTGASASHNSALILNSANTTLEGFIEAKAFGNFSAGRAAETDRELIARFQSGMSSKGLVSTQSIRTLLPQVFPGLFTRRNGSLASISVVGAADPELNRGRNTVFGITPFGLADVYVRTSNSIEVGMFTATATCKTGVSGYLPAQWEVIISSATADFPNWFYDAVSVSYVDDAGVTQTAYPKNLVYTADPGAANQLTGGNISAADVARFTKYQVCTFALELTGVEGNTPTPNTSTKEIKVLVTYMPGIGDIQDFMLQSSHRIVAADYLVKAVIPCTVTTRLSLERSSSASVDPRAIKKGIFDYVNGLDFGDSIAVSRIVDICHNFPIRRVDLPVSLTGAILLPAAATNKITSTLSNDVLAVPYATELLKYGVSAKTTMFFINYEDLAGRESIAVSMN